MGELTGLRDKEGMMPGYEVDDKTGKVKQVSGSKSAVEAQPESLNELLGLRRQLENLRLFEQAEIYGRSRLNSFFNDFYKAKERDYLKVNGSLPGSLKTKRLRKKRIKKVLRWQGH